MQTVCVFACLFVAVAMDGAVGFEIFECEENHIINLPQTMVAALEAGTEVPSGGEDADGNPLPLYINLEETCKGSLYHILHPEDDGSSIFGDDVNFPFDEDSAYNEFPLESLLPDFDLDFNFGDEDNTEENPSTEPETVEPSIPSAPETTEPSVPSEPENNDDGGSIFG